jgi:hypothetical protein
MKNIDIFMLSNRNAQIQADCWKFLDIQKNISWTEKYREIHRLLCKSGPHGLHACKLCELVLTLPALSSVVFSFCIEINKNFCWDQSCVYVCARALSVMSVEEHLLVEMRASDESRKFRKNRRTQFQYK